jgi:hypothetical protein
MLRLHRSVKRELTAERGQKIQMVRVNVGLAITVLQILLNHYQLTLASSLKVSEMKNKNHAEQAHTRMIMVLLNVNIVLVVVSAQISR